MEAESVIDDNARPGIVRPKKHNRLGASPFNFLAEWQLLWTTLNTHSANYYRVTDSFKHTVVYSSLLDYDIQQIAIVNRRTTYGRAYM